MNNDYGVTAVVSGLKDALSSYLQAQYHIRDEALVEERRKLFDTPGIIAQRAYVEATPSYASEKRLADLKIPSAARDTLLALAPLKVGVFPEPYNHQADALEAFLGRGKDVLAATGTGSGKTEIFLHNIIGSLAIEAAAKRGNSASMSGCRALLLYPMNALVADQLGRIRRLFGDDRVSALFQSKFGRRIRFGMYTSRTPYPGEQNSKKARDQIKPLFEKFYLKLDEQPALKRQLEEKGRWPKKDLHGFYNESERLWDRRLQTQPGDTELFTRHEMQRECPDILITNYSMLEYMLLRPIERAIFDQTKAWLDEHNDNYLTLVLDEAHMYRGTGGAEVAMLIRRLMARLEIPRERLRCILTSASMGRDRAAQIDALKFADELTGLKHGRKPGFELITGKFAALSAAAPASAEQTVTLAAFALNDFLGFGEDKPRALNAVLVVAPELGWNTAGLTTDTLADWLYTRLSSLPVANLLVGETTAGAKEFSVLAQTVFPHAPADTAAKATEALLSLANFARSSAKDKVFLPARLHLFFRGLQGFYACINPNCAHRQTTSHRTLLGALWPEPRETCKCGSRVYELLTHRDCGIEYLRGYISSRGRPDYLFHEKESPVGISELQNQARLREIHLLVGGQPHPKAQPSQEVWIDIKSGQLTWQPPADPEHFLPARAAIPNLVNPLAAHSFDRCPVCLGRWRAGHTKIMDLKTKGEQPFAALVKSQTFLQPPTRADKENFPNQGRKVLLFSDGRQKAARLARNIPLEVEYDSFRESLVLATQRLQKIQKEPTLSDKRIYLAFLDVVCEFNLSYFDKSDHQLLLNHVQKYRETYQRDLLTAHDEWNQINPPPRFHQALLRQLCSPYYSIPFVTAGWLEPARNAMRMFTDGLATDGVSLTGPQARDLAIAWMAELASDFAIGAFPERTRELAEGWPRDHWGVLPNLPENLRAILVAEDFTPEVIDKISGQLLRAFAQPHTTGRYFLDQDRVILRVDLNADWFECTRCHNLSPVAPFGHCATCNLTDLAVIKPDSNTYIASRKGLWRNALKECLAGVRQPRCISAEEHTAQLSYRDAGTVLATTEMHELLFQDIIIDPKKESPVDVLSCTTTMEVGVDIGSLVAVGLRNVPPQRENYQQRAGRAGRRGSAVSTVVTYCHGAPHDSHYFHNVAKMVSGPPRTPVVKTDNEKIVRRHIHAFLIQTYFQGFPGSLTGIITSALGRTTEFFSPYAGQPCCEHFRTWIESEIVQAPQSLVKKIIAWLPEAVSDHPTTLVITVAKDFVQDLTVAGEDFIASLKQQPAANSEEEEEDDDDREDKLLDFLFARGMLPTYAFPTDLCSFNVEYLDNTLVRIREKPQQSVTKALSEYAPGRIVVIDKKNYRCTAVTANTSPFERDRAAPLFAKKLKNYIFCANPLCSFVQETDAQRAVPQAACPLCNSPLALGDILKPEVFLPHCGKEADETDDDQEFSFASPAQFPIPLRKEKEDWQPLGKNTLKTFAEDRHLVVVNKGDPDVLHGFQVCTLCGKAVIDQDTGGLASHKRPYQTSYIPGRGSRPPPTCDGVSRQVLLGNDFKSDLMIMRIKALAPLETTSDPGKAAFMAMQHAMKTLAEALNLAASRHLDLDPSEFSSGFRVYPTDPQNQEIIGEIYLFDTLSGGAGYASQIGNELREVLDAEVRQLLTNCPGRCDRSCYECLRHYGNQYFHNQLDRHLALALLDYALFDTLPALDDWPAQVNAVTPLARMLEKSGVSVQLGVKSGPVTIPLVAERQGRRLLVGTAHGLYAKSTSDAHPLVKSFRNDSASPVEIINEFLLSRNRPAVHQEILAKL